LFRRVISIFTLVLVINTCELLSWEFEVVDTAGVIGVYISLAIDSQGNPHIAYSVSTYPVIDWKVMYAFNNGND